MPTRQERRRQERLAKKQSKKEPKEVPKEVLEYRNWADGKGKEKRYNMDIRRKYLMHFNEYLVAIFIIVLK